MTLKTPPLKFQKPQGAKKNIEEFINAAEPNLSEKSISSSPQETTRNVLPWEEPNVREDLQKVFNLRLPETYYIKLDYLSKLQKDSMHKICMDILVPEIDKRLHIKK